MLAILGVILAAAGAAIPVVLYIREGGAKITVSGQFDKTGFVEVVIAKRGRAATQIESLELVRAGTNTRLSLMSRSKTGPIPFGAGHGEERVYFKLTTGATKTDAIEALVRHGGKSHRVTVAWTDRHIVPQDGTEMIDLRQPAQTSEAKAATAQDSAQREPKARPADTPPGHAEDED